jgi:hypothetical protein
VVITWTWDVHLVLRAKPGADRPWGRTVPGMPEIDEDLPTGLRSADDLSAMRLSALFKEWDAIVGEGAEQSRQRAAIVAELVRYYPEDAGLGRIATLLGADVALVAHYRSAATAGRTGRTD